MSREIFWLVLTVAMTGLFWVPYILDRTMVRGLMGAMANPSPSDKPQSTWAQRMMAAHTNAVENLVIFAPLVLAAQQLKISTAATVFARALFLVAPCALRRLHARHSGTAHAGLCRRLRRPGHFGAGDLQADLRGVAVGLRRRNVKA